LSSILERLKKREATGPKALFAVIAGPRLGGKTSLAGTLPGKTLLLQATVFESGCESAKALAAQNGNQLEVLNFSSREELNEIAKELATDTEFDHVYVDGLSALTDLIFREPKIAMKMKSDNWAAFRELGEAVTDTILRLKELTYSEKAKKPKNVLLTCALAVKLDKNGSVVDVSLEAKGNVAVTQITKLGEAVLTVAQVSGEGGVLQRRLITKSTEIWPGRIDGLLDSTNPGSMEPDLNQVLKLVGGGE